MTYAECKLGVKRKLHGAAFTAYAGCRIISGMAQRPTYLRQWRKHLHLTQAQVTDRLGHLDDPLLPTTAASLSRIENGRQPYSQRILEALADLYGITPGDLLGRDPAKEGRIYDLVARMNAQQLVQAEAVLEALSRAAEDRLTFTPAPPDTEPLVKRR